MGDASEGVGDASECLTMGSPRVSLRCLFGSEGSAGLSERGKSGSAEAYRGESDGF